MSAKSSCAVMVLPVHIIGDRSANSHKACSRRDRKKPSLWKKDVNNVREAHTRFAAHDAIRFVERQNTIESTTIDKFAPCIETRITITASKTIRQQRTCRRINEYVRYLVIPCRFVDSMMRDLRIPTPGESSRYRRGWKRHLT